MAKRWLVPVLMLGALIQMQTAAAVTLPLSPMHPGPVLLPGRPAGIRGPGPVLPGAPAVITPLGPGPVLPNQPARFGPGPVIGAGCTLSSTALQLGTLRLSSIGSAETAIPFRVRLVCGRDVQLRYLAFTGTQFGSGRGRGFETTDGGFLLQLRLAQGWGGHAAHAPIFAGENLLAGGSIKTRYLDIPLEVVLVPGPTFDLSDRNAIASMVGSFSSRIRVTAGY
jgi:hypothetical protein